MDEGEIFKAMAQGAVEGALNKIGEFGRFIFPNKNDENEAIDYFKKTIEGSTDLNILEKTVLIANSRKIIREACRKANIANKANDILVHSNIDQCSIEKAIVNDEEWFERFFDASKFVTEDNLQTIWANILAQKIISPNEVPKSITRILIEISSEQAKALQVIANMVVVFFRLDEQGNVSEVGESLFVPETKDSLKKYGININVLEELETLGVLKLDEYGYDEEGQVGVYYNHLIIEPYDYSEEGRLTTGRVKLTRAGMCLAKIAPPMKFEGYIEIVRDYMEKRLIGLTDEKLVICKCDSELENKIKANMENMKCSLQ